MKKTSLLMVLGLALVLGFAAAPKANAGVVFGVGVGVPVYPVHSYGYYGPRYYAPSYYGPGYVDSYVAPYVGYDYGYGPTYRGYYRYRHGYRDYDRGYYRHYDHDRRYEGHHEFRGYRR